MPAIPMCALKAFEDELSHVIDDVVLRTLYCGGDRVIRDGAVDACH